MLDMKKYQRLSRELQDGMARAQEELAQAQVEGVAGGGALKVVANGNLGIDGVKIAPEAVDPDDVAMLEDLFKAAANQAIEKAKTLQQETLSRLTGHKLPQFPFI